MGLAQILQARFQQNVNHELPDVQAGFRKGRGTRDQIANIHWIMEKGREFQKNIYFCFIDYAKAFDCVDHNKLWKILKDMGIPNHLTCLLRNLYAGQEATVRTGHGTTDWFQIRKGVRQGCILSPCLFNFYGEHIMRNAGLKEAQAGIKIARRNINNLRYADDTTLMAKREEELKGLLMKVKEESEKVGFSWEIKVCWILVRTQLLSDLTSLIPPKGFWTFLYIYSQHDIPLIWLCLMRRRSQNRETCLQWSQSLWFSVGGTVKTVQWPEVEIW